jgi:hypothetical protein
VQHLILRERRIDHGRGSVDEEIESTMSAPKADGSPSR